MRNNNNNNNNNNNGYFYNAISIAVQWPFKTNKEALTVPCFVVKQLGNG